MQHNNLVMCVGNDNRIVENSQVIMKGHLYHPLEDLGTIFNKMEKSFKREFNNPSRSTKSHTNKISGSVKGNGLVVVHREDEITKRYPGQNCRTVKIYKDSKTGHQGIELQRRQADKEYRVKERSNPITGRFEATKESIKIKEEDLLNFCKNFDETV